MGGSAFAARDKPLSTPRMPRDVYEAVRNRCHALLREHYHHVASPIEGPSKIDFGDVDIFVSCPKNAGSTREEQLNNVVSVLGASDAILQQGETSSNLAIPWPDDPLHHIQVDVQVCHDERHLGWLLFRHSHGDFCNIVGWTVRPYGLTLDEKALWVRIPEVEGLDKKRARIFLTAEPAEVLEFLDLNARAWHTPFGCLGDMFEYVAQCRMFYVRAKQELRTDVVESHDRRRMAQRPAFRQWMDGFVAECREQGRFLKRRTCREEVTDEALQKFGVRDEFYARKREMLLQQQRQVITSTVIKESLPLPDGADLQAVLHRSCQVKAFKSIILEGHDRFGVPPPGNDMMDEDGLYDMDKVRAFIAENKDEVGRAAMVMHRQRQAEAMALKKRSCKDEADALSNSSNREDREEGGKARKGGCMLAEPCT